jgi:hypothetical protein
MTARAAPRSCASCDETSCAMNRRHGLEAPPAARTAYVMDDVWPEYASMIAASLRPGDQLLAPGLLGPRPARYRWPQPAGHAGAAATARRHFTMRRVARASGAVRQQAYLDADRALARALARRIDYHASHLVVAQAWLPWLDEAGMLGGRSYDVAMSRYPFAEIHRRLDEAAAEIGPSPTISDFRANPDFVARETDLLARARRIVTPHHGIAALFAGRATQLAWHRPPATAPTRGDRVAFLGPTIARQRPDIARALAEGIDSPLIVFGSLIEGEDPWGSLNIERRGFGQAWLEGVGAIIHPAVSTSQPRRLLQAIAAGVTVYATPASGLDPGDYRPLSHFAGVFDGIAAKAA